MMSYLTFNPLTANVLYISPEMQWL